MLYKEYLANVQNLVASVADTQSEKIEKAAELVANAWKNDGMLYVFGCGHSHIIGEDLFYRAGGTAAICAMLDSD